jgi:hypothetical protein
MPEIPMNPKVRAIMLTWGYQFGTGGGGTGTSFSVNRTMLDAIYNDKGKCIGGRTFPPSYLPWYRQDGTLITSAGRADVFHMQHYLERGWRLPTVEAWLSLGDKAPPAPIEEPMPEPKLPLKLAIKELLTQGRKETADIATRLNANSDSVKSTLNRNKTLFKHYANGWGLVK